MPNQDLCWNASIYIWKQLSFVSGLFFFPSFKTVYTPKQSLQQQKFWLDMSQEKLIQEQFEEHNGSPKAAVQSVTSEILKTQLGKALSNQT